MVATRRELVEAVIALVERCRAWGRGEYAATVEAVEALSSLEDVDIRALPGVTPDREALEHVVHARGYRVATGSFNVRFAQGQHVWRFVAQEVDRRRAVPLTGLGQDLAGLPGVDGFEIGHARN